jgi:hypothetical protein
MLSGPSGETPSFLVQDRQDYEVLAKARLSGSFTHAWYLGCVVVWFEAAG